MVVQAINRSLLLDTANAKVYFADRYANDIKRANLDGSNVEVVVFGRRNIPSI